MNAALMGFGGRERPVHRRLRCLLAGVPDDPGVGDRWVLLHEGATDPEAYREIVAASASD